MLDFDAGSLLFMYAPSWLLNIVMATLEQSRISQKVDLETTMPRAKLAHQEDLQDMVQSQVQRALADGKAYQPPVAGNSSERQSLGSGMGQRLGSPSVLVSLGVLGPEVTRDTSVCSPLVLLT